MNVPKNQKMHSLAEVTGFGSNPGALRCWLHLPSILAPKAPLVVVLHGCTQDATGFDLGSGWTKLAEEKGFAVLFPEQQRSNNANLCFNWFEPGDMRRDAGEALSIKEMIAHAVEAHGLDRGRVFVTGLSAGGAMANVMLANYPELFAGGAIIGGLPYGVASGVGQAFERMQGRNSPTAEMLLSSLAAVSRDGNPIPRISVWHGTHDQTVRPVNAQQIATQWIGAHGLNEAPDKIDIANGNVRKVWLDIKGREVVELHLIKGMAHGVPLSANGKVPLGEPGPFMLDMGISSTARIARNWGLIEGADVVVHEGPLASPPSEPRPDGVESLVEKALSYAKIRTSRKPASGNDARSDAVGRVITDALRAAGLMK
jgi:poly(hydroxyalkanoate) depolymerase family esterase